MRANSRFNVIISHEKPVLVDFYAEWCQPCRQVQSILKELKGSFKEDLRILKVNVDRNPLIAKQFQVRNIPTLMLFKEGSVKWCGEGIIGVSELKSIIQKYIGI